MSDAPQLTIAAFGDSLFEGWGLMPDQSVPAQLEKLLRQEGRNLRMLNFGVSGETAGEGLLRVDQVVKAKPDLALLEFGANDFYQLVDPEETQDQLAAIIETFQAKAIPVLLVGICCLADFTGEEFKADFDPIFTELAEHFSVPLFPDILASYVHSPDLLMLDGIHPNPQGALAIAQALLPSVLDALPRGE